MAIYRYSAVVMHGPARGLSQHGEMSGACDADVRAALRRIGLQVVDLKPLQGRSLRIEWRFLDVLTDRINHHLRLRRRAAVSELYDSLATMLESGMPLLETIETVLRSAGGRRRRSSLRTMLVHVREELRSGRELAEAMDTPRERGQFRERGRGWFDPIEIAMVRAGYHAGDLPNVLRGLAERHERSESLNQKVISALAYPSIVALAGVGVAIFLSVRTLPDLVRILTDARIEPPALTVAVMAAGGWLASWWWILIGAVIAGPVLILIALHFARRLDRIVRAVSFASHWLYPDVLKRIAVANVAQRLAELVRCGVPVVDALRIIAPTAPRPLRAHLQRAAARVEGGDDLSEALSDGRWFDHEFRQLVMIGQQSGELDDLLERLAQRTARRAARLLDRAAALLEPAVIIALAVMIGIVVMAAVLPLVKLQEVL